MRQFLAFILKMIRYLLSKFKLIVFQTIKHPFSSIFWVIKMYFALMFLSLFVACSFSSIAATPVDDLEYDPTDWRTPRTTDDMYCSTWRTGICAETIKGLYSKVAPQYLEVLQRINPSDGDRRTTFTLVSLNDGMNLSYRGWTEDYSPAFGWYGGRESINPVPSGYNLIPGGIKSCPPIVLVDESNPADVLTASYVIGPIGQGGDAKCHRPKPKQNSCFKSPDFQLAPQYHFDPSSSSKPMVCVENESGDLCPWSGDGTGVFKPYTSPTHQCENNPPVSPPSPKPQPPQKCVNGGNGMKVCEADPNDKCTALATGQLSCGSSCGYMNGKFMCFTEPDIPDDPNQPDDKPKKPVDDSITDSDKKMPDLTKKDLKDIQKGMENRLDNLSIDLQNTLQAAKYSDEKADNKAALSNKLLNSINQNTSDTVGELKKINTALNAGTGDSGTIQVPEFDSTNDWEKRNFGTVIKATSAKIFDLPIMKSINGFFDVSFSGQCPVYSVSIWVYEITIDQFCTDSVQSVFPYIKAVVLFMFSILAIRTAIL